MKLTGSILIFFLFSFLLQAQSPTGGIGCAIDKDSASQYVIIRKVFPGLPAAKAGLKEGDIIVAIDRHSTYQMPLPKATKLMHGKIGSNLDLQIKRGDDSFKVSVRRERLMSASTPLYAFCLDIKHLLTASADSFESLRDSGLFKKEGTAYYWRSLVMPGFQQAFIVKDRHAGTCYYVSAMTDADSQKVREQFQLAAEELLYCNNHGSYVTFDISNSKDALSERYIFNPIKTEKGISPELKNVRVEVIYNSQEVVCELRMYRL